MSLVQNLILHFEDLSATMDNRKTTLNRNSQSHEKNSSKVKRLITEFTDIKRPANKQKLGAENANTDVKCQTLPRNFKNAKNQNSTTDKNIHQHISVREGIYKSSSISDIKQKLLPEMSKQTSNIEKEVEEFGDMLRQRREQTRQTTEKLKNFFERKVLNDSDETIKETKGANLCNYCEVQDEINDDTFGLNTFEDSEDDNYIVEAYNKVDSELVIVTLEIQRRTIVHDEVNEEITNLIIDSDYIVHKSGPHSSSSNSIESETYENSHEEDGNISEDSTILLYDDEPYESTYYYSTYNSDTKGPDKDVKHNDFYQNMSNFSTEVFSTNVEVEGNVLYQNMSYFPTCENLKPLPETSEKKQKIDFLLAEINSTEETYVAGLRYIVEKYIPYLHSNTPKDLIGRTTYLFGNIEEIYKTAKRFLNLMKENSYDADSLAQIFIDSASEFELYPLYSKNKPTADIYCRQFEDIIKERQVELNDKLGLASFLLTPIQRLGKYVLLLEEIQKQLRKSKPNEKVAAAINVVRGVMRKGNDYIAIDSIKDSPIDLTDKGSFIMRSNFAIIKPRKFQSMVFLFHNIIVFTEKTSKNTEYFKYYDSIALSDLSLGKCEDKPNVFYLTDYTRKKRVQSDATFVLLAESAKVKKEWTETIEIKLWSQLEKAKEQQRQLHHRHTVAHRHTPKICITNESIRRSKKYQNKMKAKSKFYDHQP